LIDASGKGILTQEVRFSPRLASGGSDMIWAEHVHNRNHFPQEELAKYYGQHVAWSIDGKRILAGAKDPVRLDALVQAAGYKSDEYVLSFVDHPDEVIIGGFQLLEPEQETGE
jgi:hypothetical protein